MTIFYTSGFYAKIELYNIKGSTNKYDDARPCMTSLARAQPIQESELSCMGGLCWCENSTFVSSKRVCAIRMLWLLNCLIFYTCSY